MAQQERAGAYVRRLVLSRIALLAAALLFAIAAILPDPASPLAPGPMGDLATQAVFLDASGDDEKLPILPSALPAARPQLRFNSVAPFRVAASAVTHAARYELELTQARGPPLA